MLTQPRPVDVSEQEMVKALQQALRGEVIGRDHPGYAHARRVWNGLIDRKPAVIARCASTADVVEAVRIAREHRPEITVRAPAGTRPLGARCAMTPWSSTCPP
jgi:FAD/FMN-containing dehydrogenase